MASGHAPSTIPSVGTGTPLRGLSESLSESNPARETSATFSEIEGRKPNPDMTEETQREDARAMKELQKQESQAGNEPESTTTRDQPSAGTTLVQTAKQYMPEPVGKVVDYAAKTAASYIPDPQGIKDTMSSYLSSGELQERPYVSLPSTELKGALPAERTGGVGALPGNLSESSVALLPEERQERAQKTSPLSRGDTIKPSAESGGDELPKSEEETTQDIMPPKNEPITPLPLGIHSESPEARTGEPVGADAITSPGPESEVESQRGTSKTKIQQPFGKEAEAAAATGIGMVGMAPPSEEPAGVEGLEGPNLTSEKLNEVKGQSQDAQENGNEEKATITVKTGAGYGGEYHPAQLHPPPPGASVAEYNSALERQQEGQESPTTEPERRVSVSAEKKPGFMSMVKGEMKILAGRMSGDELKVEEGKKIIHGEA